jgi:hypothetical protein
MSNTREADLKEFARLKELFKDEPEVLGLPTPHYRCVGHLVSIKGKHCTFKARFFPNGHDAGHCMKQWKEQHPYYEGCTFTKELVYLKTEVSNG